MKYQLFWIPLIFLSILFFGNIANAENTKRALIIAVGDYDKAATGWSPISSANDVPLVRDALVSQGFKADNIAVLQDEKATKKAVIEYLNTLVKETQPGDVVVIHYSGHGQQITDNNNDEVDGYDEALIPVDAKARFTKGVYEGENHIRDDEMGELLNKIRKRAGTKGSVLLIMDSCHSGTSSRGLAKTRGTQETFDTAPANQSAAKEEGTFGLETKDDENLAPLICFYGASAHELNYETTDANGNGVGSLSLAFSDAFANAKPTQTYKELFDQVRNKMAVLAPKQSPQAEGDLNLAILGGEITGKKMYYNVTNVYNKKSVAINGGNLMGVYENSEVAFYALGDETTEDKIIATGKVVFSDAVTADIELTNTAENIDLKACKVIVTKENFGNIGVTVQLNLKEQKLEAKLNEEFKKYPLIKVVDNGGDLILEENNEFTRGEKLYLITALEYELFANSYSDVDVTAKDITRKILAFAQAKYLRQIEMYSEDFDVRFEFIPVRTQKVGRGSVEEVERFSIDTKRDASGNISFTAGDYFKIKIINDGYEVAYYSILDFQPDNQIGVLIPGKNQNAADYVIKPGEEKELPRIYQFNPPYGTEVFKLVASKEPIDFRSILLNKGAHRGTSDSNNPFATLVSASFRVENASSRGTETVSVAPGNCNIQSVTFSIVEK